MTMTRRQFLSGVGLSGGYGAAYVTMQGLGLLPEPVAYAGPPTLEFGSGKGVAVVILGAGIAGMTAAYELQKAGYQCTILEARERAGGRNWTLRRGTKVQEFEGPAEICEFDDALYFNAGPARIPSHHHGLLGYCKAFGVELEVFVNANRSALFHNQRAFDGRPIQSRQLHNDSAGYISELLAKAIKQDALDEDLTADDKGRLLAYLKRYGDLDADSVYRGSSRAGYKELPNAGLNPGVKNDPLDFSALLNSKFWHWHMHHEKVFDQQATMFQPVGGMDRIAAAFERHVGQLISYRAEVNQIRNLPELVRVLYSDPESGSQQMLEADYCICTLPLPTLSKIDNEFSPEVKLAIDAGASSYASTCKLAWQANRRFWEEDFAIYGGISWTDREITQIWYPCSGYLGQKGILIGAYNFLATARAFGGLNPDQRAGAARDSGELIHPGFAREVSNPISIAWQNVPYSEGGWINWRKTDRETHYKILNKPVGRVYLAGEHLSYNESWQEGAVQSAHTVVSALDERVRSSRL
jgi:monoamine oxidase